ncbi:kinase-like protein [Obba rivulosa]|uniref:Kinase-like protein n=1 Tax=Obba rivulosa TaxID=1052685 RepID=A0A8E2DLL0_9APHY|nr:kinase-like protein [Obba rivulosa]
MLRTICGQNGICPSSFTIREQAVKKNGERCIGSGGFADVYLGICRGEEVALKVWRIRDEEAMKDFCKEAVVLNSLRHENITSFYGVETNLFPLCLVCEWMPFGTIVSYLKNQPSANRLTLLVDIVAGLSDLHNMDIIHGDLKGSNILINGQHRACLCDFGLAAFTYGGRTMGTTSIKATTTVGRRQKLWIPSDLDFRGPM